MSTKNIPTTPLLSTVLTISGAYLFFVTLVIAPFVNIPIFFPLYTTTKLLLATSAALVALMQLFIALPRLKLSFLQRIPNIVKRVSIVFVGSAFIAVLASYSVKTSLFGLFSFWDSNIMIYLVVTILTVAWFSYFILLKSLDLDVSLFHTFMTLLVVVTAVVSIGEYYLWQNDTGYTALNAIRVSLGFRNPLFAAYFIGMLWTYTATRTVVQIVERNNRIRAIFSLLLFGSISLALILTFTRSAWISAAISLLIMVLLLITRRPKIETLRILIASTVLFSGALLLAYPYRSLITARNSDLDAESQSTFSTIAATLGSNDATTAASFYQNTAKYSSASIRLLEWKWGLRTWTGSVKNFLFGVGPDAGYFALPYYRSSLLNDIPTEAAVKPTAIRTIFINFPMEFGAIATLSICVLLFWFVKHAHQRSSQDSSIIFALSLIVGYFTQGIFYYSSILPILLLALAVSFTFSRIVPKDEVIISPPNNAEKLLLGLIATVLLMWIIPIAQASIQLERYSRSPLPQPEDVMIRNTNIAINNNIFKRFLAYHYATSPAAIEALVDLRNSNNIDDLRIAGDAYYLLARNSSDETALTYSIEAYEKMTSIEGTLPASWDALGIRYLAQGDYAKARDTFLKAIELKPDYWYAYLHVGETLRQQCQPTEAITWYQKVEPYVPLAANEIKEAQDELTNPQPQCPAP